MRQAILALLVCGCTTTAPQGKALRFHDMEITVSDSDYVEFDEHRALFVAYTVKNQAKTSIKSLYAWYTVTDAEGRSFSPVRGKNAVIQPLDRFDYANFYDLPRGVDMTKPLYFGMTNDNDPKQLFRIELRPKKLAQAPAWWGLGG